MSTKDKEDADLKLEEVNALPKELFAFWDDSVDTDSYFVSASDNLAELDKDAILAGQRVGRYVLVETGQLFEHPATRKLTGVKKVRK